MIKLNIKANGIEQEKLKEYLENNASEILAEKINNGVRVVKDNKTFINKKDLKGFWKYATDEAKKIAEKGATGTFVDDNTVYGWLIHYFEEDENPLVLVSPSMSEGVDLPYDKCRFQVIYKIPFPYLGDKQVDMRRRRDQKWYAYKTVMTLMQAYGRGMRAEDDSCYTYILDSDVNMILKSPLYRSLIPDFFKEAIVRIKD